MRRGDPASARKDLRRAVAVSSSGADRCRLLARLARLASGADDMGRAAALVEMALAEAGNDQAARADALYTAALIDMNMDQQSRAETRLAEALTMFEQLGHSRGVADILDGRAMKQFLDGDVTGSIDAFGRVAALFLDVGDLLRVVTPRSMRGHALVFAGKPVGGLPHNDAALDLARTLGHADGEALAMWQRSEALTALGRLDEAVASAVGRGRSRSASATVVGPRCPCVHWASPCTLAVILTVPKRPFGNRSKRASKCGCSSHGRTLGLLWC